ncbi:MAG: hypothetical protein U0Q03_11985 [Acidimicrobiales bacterium]
MDSGSRPSSPWLIAVGYWLGPQAPGWPDVRDFVDEFTSLEGRSQLADALDDATPTDWACMGYSMCRICGARNGSGERTNGQFVWPEGLGHYVREHAVRLPSLVEESVLAGVSDPVQLARAIEAPIEERDHDWWRAFVRVDEDLTARPSGWPGQLARSYGDVRGWLAGIAERHHAFGYLVDILDDAIAANLGSLVGLGTSMHDLVFAPLPAVPPFDAVVVRAPGSLRPPRDGNVRIEFVAAVGRVTSIERPTADALALFWRFMNIEFGITRTRR